MFAKVCGITRLADALHAVEHGATALGFIFWPRSPRYIAPERAGEIIAELPDTVTAVGVFMNHPSDDVRAIAARTGIAAIQLHGDEPPAYAEGLAWPLLRAASIDNAEAILDGWPEATLVLLDTHDPVLRGGTGRAIDWSRAAEIARARRVVLAGGLTPDNVREAIETVRPFGVDVSSGVESSPGVKDFDKVARFLENARDAFNGY